MDEESKKVRSGVLTKVLVAGVVVTVILIGYFAIEGFQPSKEDVSGSIVGVKKAEKYRAEQMTEEDVLLGNQMNQLADAEKAVLVDKMSDVDKAAMINRLSDVEKATLFNKLSDAEKVILLNQLSEGEKDDLLKQLSELEKANIVRKGAPGH